MSSARPLVSICIPLYNGWAFIEETILSVLSQSYANWEMIVMDDGSTDDSGSLVQRFVDPRIRYYRNTQAGMQGNFNRLLESSRGKYIKLLCQDDLIHPDCVQQQVDVMEDPGHERIVLVTSTREIIDARGAVLFRRQWFRKDKRISGMTAVKKMVRAGTNLIGEPSAVLFRASERERCGGFDGRLPYVIDVDYWIRLLSAGDCFFLAKPLSRFRISRYGGSFRMLVRQGAQFPAYARRLQRNPAMKLSRVDVLLSWFGAQSKALLRQAVYLIYWRRLVVS